MQDAGKSGQRDAAGECVLDEGATTCPHGLLLEEVAASIADRAVMQMKSA
jgi:hypothetical protein